MRRSVHRRRSLFAATWLVVAAGCAATMSGPAHPRSASPVEGSGSPPVESSQSSAIATSTEGAVPPELAGTWRRSYQGDVLLLTLRGTAYTVQGPDTGAGRISVEGDRITFSNSNRCPDGVGTYVWHIEDDGRLRLTLTGDDPCGRPDFLQRATWGRAEN
jgi:hypothetical protein